VPPIPVIIFVAVLMAGSLFFQLSRDAPLKRRLWPQWLLIVGAAFVVFGWLIGGPLMAVGLLVGSVVFRRLSMRHVQFCNRCGRTVNSVAFLNPAATHCPSCGAVLADRTSAA
jgi:hypothetical protein